MCEESPHGGNTWTEVRTENQCTIQALVYGGIWTRVHRKIDTKTPVQIKLMQTPQRKQNTIYNSGSGLRWDLNQDPQKDWYKTPVQIQLKQNQQRKCVHDQI